MKGETQVTVLLNTSGNTSKTACVDEIRPNANGEITITVTAGPNNNNGSGFFYLNAFRLSPAD